MIELHHLSKSLGGRIVIRDVSFTAFDFAITGILGANGAGKTTTMRLMCGALRQDSGSISINGSVGALLDRCGIYSRLTVRENLVYFGELRQIPPALLNKRVEAVLSTMGLVALADRRAAGLSQGERMKVALGRVLLHSPRNLILDEPTNGLDIPTVRSLRMWLKGMRDSGTCIVLSSHVLGDIEALCDRIVILSGGTVAAEGSSAELRCHAGAQSLEDAFASLI